MKRQKLSPQSRITFLILFIIVVLAIAVNFILRIFTTSGYFNIKEVVVSGKPDKEINYLKGRNIFLLDLRKESESIARYSPESLRVNLVRIFPDRIFVDFVQRKPVALVSLYRYFAVDENGVLFEAYPVVQGKSLTVITGLNSKITKVIPGEKVQSKELALALAIIREAKKFRNLSGLEIQKIDIEGVDYVTILIPVEEGGKGYSDWHPPERQKTLEVRISRGNILEKIAVMSGLIGQEKNNLKDIKYIDLRFNEPVIKFKDAK